jgi:hypothetical protein
VLETLLSSPFPAGGDVGIVVFLFILPSFAFLVVFEMKFYDGRGYPVILSEHESLL